MLQKYAAILSNSGISLYYAWEKMTNFNTISIIAKFFTQLLTKLESEKRTMSKTEKIQLSKSLVGMGKYFFKQIREMPNYLTRLLIIKQVFQYIEDFPISHMPSLFQEILYFLTEINQKYQNVQACILETAVLVKWNFGGKRSITSWTSELQKEYPIELFENLILSCNVKDIMKYVIPLKTHSFKDLSKILKGDDYRCLVHEICRKGCSKNDLKNALDFVSGVDLLDIIKEYRYSNESQTVARKMQEEGWVTVDSFDKDAVQDNSGHQEETPVGMIETEFTDVKSISERVTVKSRDLEKAIGQYLLSHIKNVVFEESIEDKKTYEYFANYLLYHFYD